MSGVRIVSDVDPVYQTDSHDMVHTYLRPFFSRTFQGLFKDKSFSFKDLIFYSIRHTCNKPIDINDFLYGMLCKETCNINRKLP